jgi:HSP20 family molecular chaperone IbpA
MSNQINGTQSEFGTDSHFWGNKFNQQAQGQWGFAPTNVPVFQNTPQGQTWSKDPTNWSMWAGAPGTEGGPAWWQTNSAHRATWNGFDRANVFCPAMSVAETTASFQVWCELPGVSDKDISLTWFNGTLSIRGQKRNMNADSQGQGQVWVSDQFWGQFFRSISFAQFASGIDSSKISTKFVNGVLEVTLPKTQGSTAAHIKVATSK